MLIKRLCATALLLVYAACASGGAATEGAGGAAENGLLFFGCQDWAFSDEQQRFSVSVLTWVVLQRARVLARPGMTVEKLDTILARQLPDAEKRARADFVVDTGGAIPDTRTQIDAVVAALRARVQTADGAAFRRSWS